MTIYVFSLLVGYAPNGVDYAQGYRARIFRKFSCKVRYIFPEIPGRNDIRFYERNGIEESEMLSMHHFFLDHSGLELSVRVEDKLQELKRNLQVTDVINTSSEIRLVKDNFVVATLVPSLENRDILLEIRFFDQFGLVRSETYTDRLAYADYYVDAQSDQGHYAKRTRRVYYHSDGAVAYEQIFDEKKFYYLFPEGRIYTKSEFTAEFVRRLKMTEEDIVLIDRFAQFDYVQPLFCEGRRARLIAVMHAGHYFVKGESAYTVNFNQDYNYLMRYTKLIDLIVVSTQQQKEELTNKLQEYGRHIPEIKVILAGGADKLRYPNGERKAYSILSVSRVQIHKRIHWIVMSVIKAHEVNEKISLSIYGVGNVEYMKEMKKTVEKYQASSYIRFMGHQEVAEVYKNYELFVTASTFETLGLSTLEAISSGNAVIGLTAKYGSSLLIRPEENGYLIDFVPGVNDQEEDRIINDMAERIVEVFEDRERLHTFQENSYIIATGFMTKIVEEKWKELLQDTMMEMKEICGAEI